MQANSGQFINDQLWGQTVRVALLHVSWCQVAIDMVHAVTPTMHAWTCLPACCSHQTEKGVKSIGMLQQWCKAGVHDSMLLYAQEPVTAQNAGERLQTRCERETLSRFPRTGAILFTIRTHMRKLKTFEGRPDKVKHSSCTGVRGVDGRARSHECCAHDLCLPA